MYTIQINGRTFETTTLADACSQIRKYGAARAEILKRNPTGGLFPVAYWINQSQEPGLHIVQLYAVANDPTLKRFAFMGSS